MRRLVSRNKDFILLLTGSGGKLFMRLWGGLLWPTFVLLAKGNNCGLSRRE